MRKNIIGAISDNGSRALCCLLLRGFIRRQKQMAIKRVLTTVPRSEQWEHREAREPSTTMERSGIVVDEPKIYEGGKKYPHFHL